MLKLRTVKIAYWVFCASKHNRKFQILTFGEIHTIRFSNFNRIRIRILFGFGKSCEYEYEQYSVLKNHPNTNTNSIRFENICRIRIRISLFGLNYSNTIRIPNYSLTSAPLPLPSANGTQACPYLLYRSPKLGLFKLSADVAD